MSLLFELMDKKIKKIIITTGDLDGIGLEVTLKALAKIGPQKNTFFILMRSKKASEKSLSSLDRKFNRVTASSLQQALNISLNKNTLIDVASSESPPKWVEDAAKVCLKKLAHGLVTAPMSKELIVKSGFSDIGHTDILSRVSKTKNLCMGFVGDKFNVVLATGHIPHKNVSQTLTLTRLKSAISKAEGFSKQLGLTKKPIGLLGLNPHAGERGLIGKEESKDIKLAVAWSKKKKIRLAGPLVPDAAFLRGNWPKYSCYVACYHDQGLIPFKMIHGQDSGCHISLGLPFIRTSVDHGTAKDIFGKNRANPNSMISALQCCLRLSKG